MDSKKWPDFVTQVRTLGGFATEGGGMLEIEGGYAPAYE